MCPLSVVVRDVPRERPPKRALAEEHAAVFADYQVLGEKMGFRYVASGPLVRSSYKAGEFFFERMARVRRASTKESE